MKFVLTPDCSGATTASSSSTMPSWDAPLQDCASSRTLLPTIRSSGATWMAAVAMLVLNCPTSPFDSVS